MRHGFARGKVKQRRGQGDGGKARVSLAASEIATLLAQPGVELNCAYLAEPALNFGGKAQCVDPRTGLAAFGPYSKTDSTRRQTIRLGIVGPADAIDRAVALIERLAKPIHQSEKIDAILHPPFPGLNSGEPFQIELASQTVWRRPLRTKDVALVEGDPDFKSRIGKLLTAVITEVRALKAP